MTTTRKGFLVPGSESLLTLPMQQLLDEQSRLRSEDDKICKEKDMLFDKYFDLKYDQKVIRTALRTIRKRMEKAKALEKVTMAPDTKPSIPTVVASTPDTKKQDDRDNGIRILRKGHKLEKPIQSQVPSKHQSTALETSISIPAVVATLADTKKQDTQDNGVPEPRPVYTYAEREKVVEMRLQEILLEIRRTPNNVLRTVSKECKCSTYVVRQLKDDATWQPTTLQLKKKISGELPW